MKVQLVITVLSLVVLGCHATQWQDIKSSLDSPFYKQIIDKLFPADAGRNNNGKITNGVPADLGQFPFQVYLYLYDNDTIHLCGGSLINPRWILTAAHCIAGMDRIQVFFGAINRYGDGREGAFIRQIDVTNPDSIIPHPDFDALIFANDIGLIELPEDAPVDHPLVRPLPLPRGPDANRNLVGENGTVAGFGRISDTVGDYSAYLFFVNLPIAENLLCSDIFVPGLVTERNICLQSVNQQSTCQGDAGGPLTVAGANGENVQVGIISFGAASGCTLGYPQVLTRVSSFVPWIDSQISPSRTCTCSCQSTCTVS